MPPASLRKGPLGQLPRKTRGSLRVQEHPHAGASPTPHRPHPRWPNPATAWSSSVASNMRRGLVLVSDDAVFEGCPDLQVVLQPA
jgi:hypothetical protein